MDHAVNKAPLNHEMSTKSRGSILPAERMTLVGPQDGSPLGLESRNAFDLPDSIFDDAGGDCDNVSHWPPEGQ